MTQKLYTVLRLRTHIDLDVNGQIKQLPLVSEELGIAGCLVVFSDYDKAVQYAGGVEIVEIQARAENEQK
jgi:hypothetical protein